MQGSLGAPQQVIAGFFPGAEFGTAEFCRKRAAGQCRARRLGTVADGKDALVPAHAVEEIDDLDPPPGRQLFLQRFLDGVGDQR